jgi:TonB family protein
MRRALLFAVSVVAATLSTQAAGGQADPMPARLLGGDVPGLPVQAVAGGEVVLSITVSDTGAVGPIDVLRTTPPFTDAVVAVVRGWRFAAALDAMRKPIASRVLVGAMFGAPSVNTPTVGEPPKDLVPPATALPLPLTTSMPVYPVNARSAGTVVIETLVSATGRVVGVTAIRSSPPFDEPAMEAARGWSFRPPRGPDLPPNTYAYLVFGFRPPVVSPAVK